jgi:hypothetical protein
LTNLIKSAIIKVQKRKATLKNSFKKLKKYLTIVKKYAIIKVQKGKEGFNNLEEKNLFYGT